MLCQFHERKTANLTSNSPQIIIQGLFIEFPLSWAFSMLTINLEDRLHIFSKDAIEETDRQSVQLFMLIVYPHSQQM